MPFGVNVMRSQVLYWAAQDIGNDNDDDDNCDNTYNSNDDSIYAR